MGRYLSVIIIAFFASALIVSCSGGSSKNSETPPSSREIMEKYTDTLVTAPKKAQEAADMAGKHAEDALKDLE